MAKTAFVWAAVLLTTTLFCVTLHFALNFTNAEQMVAAVCCVLFARRTRYISVPLFVLLLPPIIYSPAGWEFGRINAAYVAALFDTNANEAVGFLHQLNWYSFALLPLLIAAAFFALFWRSRARQSVKYTVAIVALCMVLFASSGFSRFYTYAWRGVLDYYQIRSALQEDRSSFTIAPREDAVKLAVRIVVIGESVRKDYMSLYGYPHPTTPFLNNANGVFIDGFIAPHHTTTESIAALLSAKKGGQNDLENSVVRLAQHSGFRPIGSAIKPAKGSLTRLYRRLRRRRIRSTLSIGVASGTRAILRSSITSIGRWRHQATNLNSSSYTRSDRIGAFAKKLPILRSISTFRTARRSTAI
ncbi:hypothetical protein AGMMS50229_13120 [Campylobacterota bacterium]|nr:hypothetical protein AGMMS50229_13120 [Campylobacterota bacterium]